MTFTNATMLAGIAGATVPLSLHLIGRARYRSVRWGALMFLGADHPIQSRVARLKELSVLLIRMAIVATLAITLARPVLNPPSGKAANEPTSMVILIDSSPSMTIDEHGIRRRDVAARAALNTLATLRAGDEAAVIYLPQPYQAGPPEFMVDFQAAAARLNDFPIGSERANMAAGLISAANLLRKAHSSNRRIVIICDRQALNWREVTESFAATLKQRFHDGGAPPKLSIIPIGSTETANLAIERAEVVEMPVVRNITSQIDVHLHNYDSVQAADVPLTIWAGNREIYRTTVNLPAHSDSVARCNVKFTQVGPQQISAHIGGGGPLFDDTYDVAVDVVELISTLVIGGSHDNTTTGFFDDGDYAALALMPYSMSGETGTDSVRVQTATWDKWPQLDRSQFQVVVLANVPLVSSSQALQLEQYVYGGGGVLIAPGNLSRAEDYDAQLWRGGTGILPAELEPAVPADSPATALLGLDLSHPVFQFRNDRNEPLPSITFFRHFPVRSNEASGRVIGRYASGEPFLVVRTYGRGRVMLMTSSLGTRWSTLPRSTFYLPLLQSSIRYLSAGTQINRNIVPGQPIVARIEGLSAPEISVIGPASGSALPAEVLRMGDGLEARFNDTSAPGTYRMRIRSFRGTRFITFLANGPRDESDLASLSNIQWDRIKQLLGLHEVSADPQTIAAEFTRQATRRELWPFLLPAVLLLSALELALTRFWGVVGSVPK